MTLADVKLKRLTCSDDVTELKRWLGERRPVLAIDTETGGLDWWREPLRYVQFGDARTGWAIPFDDWKGLVREVIGAYDRPITFHNLKFDVLFLEANGVAVPRREMHDTQVMAHLADASRPKALKSVTARLVDPNAAAGQARLHETMSAQGWTWRTIPLEHGPYWQYAALDPVLTARAWEILHHTTALPIYDIEIRATDVLLQMERRGYRIDVDYCVDKRDKLLALGAELRRRARECFGVRNLTSNDQVARRLIADGWEPEVFTNTGKPSCAKEVLGRVDHDLARATIKCRHVEKMANAYLANFLSFADGDRVHAKINPLGTRTGRMSITHPALQTLPRDDVVVRDAFIPSDGNRLVLADYDQIELRLMAHFANARVLIDIFRSGDDIFTGMARQLFHDETIAKTDHRRQMTKTGAYSKIYGAGIEQFSATMGITDAEGWTFIRQFNETFPEVDGLVREVEVVARERLETEGVAYVVSPLGRRHPLGDREGLYKLVNYLIQGTAADVLKSRLVALDAAGVTEYAVLPIHDELDLDVPADLVGDVVRTIQDVMPEDGFSVPITVGVDVVNRWGDKYRTGRNPAMDPNYATVAVPNESGITRPQAPTT